MKDANSGSLMTEPFYPEPAKPPHFAETEFFRFPVSLAALLIAALREHVEDEESALLQDAHHFFREGLNGTAANFDDLSGEAIAAVRELLATINGDGGQHQHKVGIAQAAKDARRTIAALEAEVEALRKDAERYRWLRDHGATCRWEEGDTEVVTHPGLLDEAVDASIPKAKGGAA